MNLLKEVQELAVKKSKKGIPQLKSGLTVKVHQKIKEGNKERIQIFEGLIIKINSGHGADKTFTVRKIVGGIGVEKIFPLYSPRIEKIEVVKSSKVRRAKLYYMRNRSGKSARLKESFVNKEEFEETIEEDIITEEEVVKEGEKTSKKSTEKDVKEEDQAKKETQKEEAKPEEK